MTYLHITFNARSSFQNLQILTSMHFYHFNIVPLAPRDSTEGSICFCYLQQTHTPMGQKWARFQGWHKDLLSVDYWEQTIESPLWQCVDSKMKILIWLKRIS